MVGFNRDGCDMANRAAILIPIHIKTRKHRTAQWMNFQRPAVDVMTFQHTVQVNCLTANMTGVLQGAIDGQISGTDDIALMTSLSPSITEASRVLVTIMV
ncbi:MAG: hypothetical protein KHX19_06230 [Bifidobacterium longum]|nr:hypothetical protein [Bifidobacterium longum]